MVLDSVPAWPAIGSLAGGAGAIGLAWAIREHRGRPGVDWFLGVFAAQATWCLSYGLGLLVTGPTLRAALEATMWLGILWTGVGFLGFALEYTGRGDVIHGRLFGSVVGFGLLSTAALLSNSAHGAFWTGFGIDPVFGVATVSYAIGPWTYLVVAVETVLVASAVFLLVDTLLSYGPLYRRESAAVALSSLPPGFALVAWTLGIGPVPQLQLAPLMFVPHMLLDAYAFNRAEMFDRYPTTSRAAERTAIDDLSDPIVAIALDRQVVRLNPAAESLLGVDAGGVRDRPLDAFIDLPVAVGIPAESGNGVAGTDVARDGGASDDGTCNGGAQNASRETVTVGNGPRRRTYAVSASALTDPGGTHVGYTVVFSDVTERERRRQQLEVLNRILRHNLRNDAGVVAGYGELLVDRLDDPELVRMADAIDRRAGALAALGEKAGTVETLLSDGEPSSVDIREVVGSIIADAREREPDATIEFAVGGGETGADGPGGPDDPVGSNEGQTDGAADWTARLRTDALRAVVENSVENALDHHDGEGVERENGAPWVRARVRRTVGSGSTGTGGTDDVGDGDDVTDDADDGDGDQDRFLVTIEDDGPGIPDHEVEPVESGQETALEHGSGLGLWVVEWGAGAVGADIDYADRDPRGTRVTVRVPVTDDR